MLDGEATINENDKESTPDMASASAPETGDAEETELSRFVDEGGQPEPPAVENGGSAPILKLWAKCGSRMLERAEIACPSPEVAANLASQIFKQIAGALQQMADQQRFLRENVIIPVKSITPEMKKQLDAFQANQRAMRTEQTAAKSGIVIASH